MADRFDVRSFLIKGARVIVLILLFVVFSAFTDSFFGLNNWTNVGNILLQEAPFYILLALGMTIPMIVGGIDLSIEANISLSSFICAMTIQAVGNTGAGILTGLAVGLLMGFINGVLIARTGLPPFVATYSMNWIGKGSALVISKGGQLNGFENFRNLFNSWEGTYLLMAGIILVMAWFLYTKTAFGRETYSVGCNAAAARISGINSTKIKILAYMASGFIGAMTGMMYVAKLGAADPTLGNGFTIKAIAATLIGGASFRGAKSRVSNALIGGLIVVILNNGLIHIGVPGVWQDFAQGLIIIAAVLMERMLEKLQTAEPKVRLQ